ncbi:uncharacterized protein LOC113861858 [Abrus precatorius]|uniref:Uncharacterized protein LOC113861858 n=1 Tax=Abrus precatorius TaxID=3816 RepID=A0A8B8L7N6_ABRPR|nr:uncharacterized protein LOC113861858 [Abrus precatorius]
MSNRIVLRAAAAGSNRRQPLLQNKSSSMGSTVGEVVGGTAAECVAVCCCFPCGVANFLLLALYKVPAGLCRQMLKKRRRRRMIKEGLLQPKRRHCSCGCCDDVNGHRIYPMCANDASDITRLYAAEPDDETMALEREMWDKFYGTGFWRSSSRKESSQSLSSTPQPLFSP